MIDVVSGIIVRGGRILLTQRPASKDFPFTWECPGGKEEGSEGCVMALGRELAEELGLHGVAVAFPSVWSGVFNNLVSRIDRAQVRVTFYRVPHCFGRPQSLEGQGIGWFTAKEMATLPLSPANKDAIESIARCIR